MLDQYRHNTKMYSYFETLNPFIFQRPSKNIFLLNSGLDLIQKSKTFILIAYTFFVYKLNFEPNVTEWGEWHH